MNKVLALVLKDIKTIVLKNKFMSIVAVLFIPSVLILSKFPGLMETLSSIIIVIGITLAVFIVIGSIVMYIITIKKRIVKEFDEET